MTQRKTDRKLDGIIMGECSRFESGSNLAWPASRTNNFVGTDQQSIRGKEVQLNPNGSRIYFWNPQHQLTMKGRILEAKKYARAQCYKYEIHSEEICTSTTTKAPLNKHTHTLVETGTPGHTSLQIFWANTKTQIRHQYNFFGCHKFL